MVLKKKYVKKIIKKNRKFGFRRMKPKYASFIRTSVADITQAVGVASGGNYYFAMGLTPSFAEIQALYNYARLRYVEIIWQPAFSDTLQSTGTTSNLSPPFLYTVFDPTPTSSTTPMTLANMEQFASMKTLDARKKHVIKLFPKSSNPVYNITSAVTTYELNSCHKQWLDTTDLSGANTSPASLTEFRGFRFRIENLGTSKDGQVIGSWRIRYHIDAKQTR